MMQNSSLYVKHLSVFTDENLNWKTHINKISTKLIKGNVMLSKLWHFVNKDILLSVLCNFSLTFSLSLLSSRINLLLKKAIMILNSAAYRDYTCPCFIRTLHIHCINASMVIIFHFQITLNY